MTGTQIPVQITVKNMVLTVNTFTAQNFQFLEEIIGDGLFIIAFYLLQNM
jgi:hypothetical protein